MQRYGRIAIFFLTGILILGFGAMSGCTKKPGNQDISKLEDARGAAESAERKLGELRQERIKLEKELKDKQDELQKKEKERNDLQNKTK